LLEHRPAGIKGLSLGWLKCHWRVSTRHTPLPLCCEVEKLGPMLLAVRTSPKSILCRVDTPVARFQPVTSTTTSTYRNQPNIREVLLQHGGTSCVDSTHSPTSRQLAAPPAVPCSICLSDHRPTGCNESLMCVDSTHTGRTGPPEKAPWLNDNHEGIVGSSHARRIRRDLTPRVESTQHHLAG
jgi:hypothetical protein